MKKILFVSMLILSAFLSACVSLSDLAATDEKTTVFTGRFTVSFQQNGEAQREQGGFEWKIQGDINNPSAMRLALLSPLGSTLAVLALDPSVKSYKRASLTTPSSTEYASNLDELMTRTLGWQLPLTALTPWLGKTAPTQAPKDWLIAVPTRYGSDLPRLITANNEAQKIAVRLVFEQ